MLVKSVHGLSLKLIKAVILATISIGLMVSILQIFIDYSNQKTLPDEDMKSLVSIIKAPATSIVFSLDPGTANELLRGLLKHPSVISCRIILADGTLFASRNRPLASSEDRKLNDLLFDKIKIHQWPLVWHFPDRDEALGSLEITVDTYYYGRHFIDRAWITMASTLFYALTLTITFLLAFYLLVTRPLNSVIQSIQQVDVDAPEKTRLIEPYGHDDDEIGLLTRLTNVQLEAISSSLDQTRKAEEKLKQHSDNLETMVFERTRALSESLEQLQAAQAQLIESEKLAALGGLVAGVAHEVNTPLGIAVTAGSVLEESLDEMQKQFDEKTMTAESLQQHIQTSHDSYQMLNSNIKRATKLIADFKMTAVDQLSEKRSEFKVAGVVSALITSLHPETKKIPVSPELECPNDLTMVGLPGALTQVLSNLIVNSIRHAFDHVPNHKIQIKIRLEKEHILIDYHDNGVGVPEEMQQRIFEPFFTTKRGQGGSGLGLNIVYNLVTRKLLGRLEFSSTVGTGVIFKLILPATIPNTSDKTLSHV